MSTTSKSKPARMLLAASRADLHYLPIQKCGCTFVKNLIWRIEYGTPFENQIRVHDAEDKITRSSDLGFTLDMMSQQERAFVVIRNPVDRFFSLYMDKIVGEGHRRFPPLRAVLVEQYGLDPYPATIEAHQANCRILIAWIDKNLKKSLDLSVDPHWTPQAWRMNVVRKADLKIILLEDLREGLRLLLGSVIPDIDEAMQQLSRNESAKSFSRKAILLPEIRKEINKIYWEDRWMYERAKNFYRHHKAAGRLERLGRASEMF